MKPYIENRKNKNRRLKPMGHAKPGKTRQLTGRGPGLACKEAAGWVVGTF